MSEELEYVKELKLRYKEENGTVRRLNAIQTALEDYERIKQTKFIVIDKKISDDDLEKT